MGRGGGHLCRSRGVRSATSIVGARHQQDRRALILPSPLPILPFAPRNVRSLPSDDISSSARREPPRIP